MNIFRKVKEYDGIKKQLEKITRLNADKTEQIKKLTNRIAELEEEIKALKSEKENYKLDLRHSRSSNGGLQAKINNQNKEIEQLKKDLDEAKSGKYILKRLPKSRIPKGGCIKVKSSEKTSLIAKQFKIED